MQKEESLHRNTWNETRRNGADRKKGGGRSPHETERPPEETNEIIINHYGNYKDRYRNTPRLHTNKHDSDKSGYNDPRQNQIEEDSKRLVLLGAEDNVPSSDWQIGDWGLVSDDSLE